MYRDRASDLCDDPRPDVKVGPKNADIRVTLAFPICTNSPSLSVSFLHVMLEQPTKPS